MKSLGRTDLPLAQQDALRRAIRWEWFTIGYTIVTIAIVAFVVGGCGSLHLDRDRGGRIPQRARGRP